MIDFIALAGIIVLKIIIAVVAGSIVFVLGLATFIFFRALIKAVHKED